MYKFFEVFFFYICLLACLLYYAIGWLWFISCIMCVAVYLIVHIHNIYQDDDGDNYDDTHTHTYTHTNANVAAHQQKNVHSTHRTNIKNPKTYRFGSFVRSMYASCTPVCQSEPETASQPAYVKVFVSNHVR